MYNYTLFTRQYDNGRALFIGNVKPAPPNKPLNPAKEGETPEALANAYFIRGYTYIKEVDKLSTISKQRPGRGFTDIPLDKIALKEFEEEFLSLIIGKRRNTKQKRGKSKSHENHQDLSTSHSSLQFREGEGYFEE